MKVCHRCHTSKAPEEFQRDSKSKDGRRGSCKACLNKGPAPVIEKPVFSVKKVTIEEEAPDLLRMLQDRFECFWSLSAKRGVKARLQVHASPILTYHGETVEEVITRACN